MGVILIKTYQLQENSVERFGRRYLINYDGELYYSLASFCSKYEISQTLVKKAFSDGFSPEKAIEIARKPRERGRRCKSERLLYLHNGVEYDSLAAASRVLGITLHWLYAFQKKTNFNQDDFLNEAVKAFNNESNRLNEDKMKKCTVGGFEFSSQLEACLHFNIPLATVTSKQMKKRMTFEEALEDSFNYKTCATPVLSSAHAMNLTPCSKNDLDLNDDIKIVSQKLESKGGKVLKVYKTNLNNLVLEVEVNPRLVKESFIIYVVLHKQKSNKIYLMEVIGLDIVDFSNIEDNIQDSILSNVSYVGVSFEYLKNESFLTVSMGHIVDLSKSSPSLINAYSYTTHTFEKIIVQVQKYCI